MPGFIHEVRRRRGQQFHVDKDANGRQSRLEITNSIIIQRIEEMYEKYGVDLEFLEMLNDEQKIKGMKGVLAELDLKKKSDYTSDDLLFIKKVYSRFC